MIENPHFFSVLLCLCACLGLAGCGSSDPEPPPQVPAAPVAQGNQQPAAIPQVDDGGIANTENANTETGVGSETTDPPVEGDVTDPEKMNPPAKDPTTDGSEPTEKTVSTDSTNPEAMVKPDGSSETMSTAANPEGTGDGTGEGDPNNTGEEPEPIIPTPNPVRDATIVEVENAGGSTKIHWTDEEHPVTAVYFVGEAETDPLVISAETIGTLKKFPKLETLVISRSKLADGCYAAIGELATLKTLILGRMTVTRDDLREFLPLAGLESLTLCHLNVAETVLDELRDGLPDAEITDWSETYENLAIGKLKRLGGKIRYEGRTPDRRVISVELEGNEITDDSMRYIRGLVDLETLIATNSWVSGDDNLIGLGNLETADFSGSYLNNEGLARLASLPKLKDVNFSKSKATKEGLINLRSMKNLEALELSASGVDDESLAAITKLQQLKKLNLASSKITDEGLPQLGEMSALESLDLSKTQLTGAGFAELAGLKNLVTLNLSEVTLSQNDALAVLKNYSKLKTLDLTKAGIQDSQLEYLAEMKDLEQLILRECTGLNGSGLANLKDAENLKVLDMHMVPVTDETLRHVSGMTELETLDLGGSQVTDNGLVHLKGLKDLRKLVLSQSKVTIQGVNRLRRSLRRARIE